MRNLVAIGFLVAAACGRKTSSTGAPIPTPEVVNALVDRVKNPGLTFVAREMSVKQMSRTKTFEAIVPDGWSYDKAKQQLVLQRPDGSVSSVSFDFSCYQEPCTLADDFQEKFDDTLQTRVTAVQARVLRDTGLDRSRAFTTKDEGDLIAIDRYWWDGAKPTEYAICDVILTPDLEPSRAAFEKACDLAVVK